MNATKPLITEQYIEGIINNDRTVLARAITLIESNILDHIEQSREILKALLPRTGNSIRIGITGMPGAGKSTFIEEFGCRLTAQDHRVAVMAVDPSSSITRGSILGDKTRMEKLARDPNAFIRPSPSRGILGGVARKTRETMLLFEAAGYDILIIETIGVGQNEITVRSMVDFILLMMIAGAGDELQGIKKGIIEIADAVVFNKADGDNKKKTLAAAQEYDKILHYLSPATDGWLTHAFSCSAITGDGIDELWRVVERFKELTLESGAWEARRRQQARQWFAALIEEFLYRSFFGDPKIQQSLPSIEQKVLDGQLSAIEAAEMLLGKFKKPKK